jgi:hypothetical protein
MNKYNALVIGLIILSETMSAQANINPDISLIGTFNTTTNFIKNDPGYGKINFQTPEMELFVDGYLNPFARATANISYEGEQLGVEEIYGNVLRGLPFDIQIKAGKFLVGFGKINTIHAHAWPFLERPLFHQVFFGDGGMNDVGINASILIPTGDIYTNLELGIYKGSYINKLADSNYEDRGVNPVFVGRLSSFLSIGDYGNLEIGLSSSYGTYAKGNLILFNVFHTSDIRSFNYLFNGIDIKYKYEPDSYTAFTIQGEGIWNHRDVPRPNQFGIDFSTDKLTTINNAGAFIYFDYKFQKQFSFGLKYDYSAGIVSAVPNFYSLANDDKNSTQGIEGWFSYYPVEETSEVRFGLQHLNFNNGDGINRDPATTIKLQFLFSLGPHKAHPF